MAYRSIVAALTLFACAPLSTASAQTDIVLSRQKISDTAGSFLGTIQDGDKFGNACAAIGDHDGDGIPDVLVGAMADDDGGFDCGAVWVALLQSDGTVKAETCISELHGGFTGNLDIGDGFGVSVAALGDVDGDGTGDVAVGAWKDDDGYG